MKIRLLPLSLDLRNKDQQARGAAIEQEIADQRLEQEWRRRVRSNPKEVAALARRIQEVSGGGHA